ncbi:MAG: ABC transporter permease, partial [Ekhidna sp.]
MNFPYFIARKYFLSGKKKNFINVISIISMVVVAIGTMCLILALSVFNGLEGLLRSMYGNFDPDIVIQPTSGKSFIYDSAYFDQIQSVDGVMGVSKVIEDNVLVQYKDAQRLVRMKGVGRDFDQFSGIKNVMVSGQFPLVRDSIAYALIGRGVQYDLSLSLKNDFYTL